MVRKAKISNWFTRHYGIDQAQYELPFVDFRLDRDVPLYIDPYAISKDPTALGVECGNTIVAYFQTLLDAVRSGDLQVIKRLISARLTEPDQICLGVGKTARAGRGIGREQENHIVSALRNSTAAKTGAIQTIQELELHIPLLGPDKVSDLVSNIILGELAEFTGSVCEEYAIPTRPCPVDGFWDVGRSEWNADFYNLPAIGSDSFILVPRRFIRRDRDLMNHTEFYDKYVLDTLRRELLTADDSLVQTLRNGSRRVTKKAIRKDGRFKPTKEHISQFIVDHPEVIEAYRRELGDAFRPADPAEWSGKASEDDPQILAALKRLPTIEPGRGGASDYHNTVFGLLEFVFDQYLENFDKEFRMDGGRGRLDIIADNTATAGFFNRARSDCDARSIPIECKNYGADLGNNEFNQIIDRMGPKTSRLGMVVCRTVDDRAAIAQHVSDRWLRQNSVILVVDDNLLRDLVQMRLARNYKAIDSTLTVMARKVQYGNRN